MRTRKIFVSSRWQGGGDNFADNHKNFKWLLKKEGDFFRSCLIFFSEHLRQAFVQVFAVFLRRIAALFFDKNGGNLPEWCHKELLKKI